MTYTTEDCCGTKTIHIEDSDFCKECHRWTGGYRKCDECRKTPITFADMEDFK